MESKYIGCTKKITIADFIILSVFKNTVFHPEVSIKYMGEHLMKILVKYP